MQRVSLAQCSQLGGRLTAVGSDVSGSYLKTDAQTWVARSAAAAAAAAKDPLGTGRKRKKARWAVTHDNQEPTDPDEQQEDDEMDDGDDSRRVRKTMHIDLSHASY